MHIKPNRQSKSYVGTYNTQDPIDMLMFEHLKKNVSLLNKTDAFNNKKRIRAALRKPLVKNGPSYDWGGNLVGGIKNAGEIDVYIYDRRDQSFYNNY